MNPNQDPNQPQYSIDYLNQIAPQSKKPGLDNRMFMMIAGGGLILAIIVGIIMFATSGGGPTEKMQTLAARLQTIQTIANKSQKTIKSGDLQGANSSLNSFLTNANRDIVDPLSKNNVDIKKLDKKIVAKEANEELVQKLEDARLNAVFDRTYAREMSYQLETVAALMKDIYTTTKSKSLKDFLLETDKNLQPIKKQMIEFNAAND